MTNTAAPALPPSSSKSQSSVPNQSFTPNFVRRRRCGQLAEEEQDSFAAYRHLAEVRMRRLERYKKAKSLCSLNHQYSKPSSALENNLLSKRTSSTGYLGGGEWKVNNQKPLRYSPPTLHFSSSHSNLLLYSLPSSNMVTDDSICVDSEASGSVYCGSKLMTRSSYLDNHKPSSSCSSSSEYSSGCEREVAPTAPAASIQFEVLREKMISLMENDVQLLQKLLTLGETIQELRRDTKQPASVHSPSASSQPQPALNKASSTSSRSSSHSISEIEEEGDDDSEDVEGELKDEWRPMEASCSQFSQSVSAITHLYVGNEEDKQEKEEHQLSPKVQYFSRKNSVLRIPIPPRASNRFSGGKRVMVRGPAELVRSSRLSSGSCQTTAVAQEEDSGHSSTSPSAQCSPTNVSNGVTGGQEQDSGRGNSSTDGGSNRFSTFSSISSVSTTSSSLHNNFIVSHAEGEKNNLFLEQQNQDYLEGLNKSGENSAAKCHRSAITDQ